jgi:hypothetical protein
MFPTFFNPSAMISWTGFPLTPSKTLLTSASTASIATVLSKALISSAAFENIS